MFPSDHVPKKQKEDARPQTKPPERGEPQRRVKSQSQMKSVEFKSQTVPNTSLRVFSLSVIHSFMLINGVHVRPVRRWRCKFPTSNTSWFPRAIQRLVPSDFCIPSVAPFPATSCIHPSPPLPTTGSRPLTQLTSHCSSSAHPSDESCCPPRPRRVCTPQVGSWGC